MIHDMGLDFAGVCILRADGSELGDRIAVFASDCPVCALAELLAAADSYDREEPDAEARYLAAKGRARVLLAPGEGNL